HNPYYDNGVKFFSSEGKKLPDELELAIEQQLEQPMTTVDSAELGKAVRVVDAPGRYIEFCKSTVASDITLKGLKIVVDCANGAAYHIAPNVFQELGAEVIEIGTEPNGLNINLACGATQPEALRNRVLQEKANLGIALDGDGDRVVMVDHEGKLLDGDELLYIIAKHRKELGLLRGGVIGTVMSNLGLEQALHHLDIEFIRVPVGDRYVVAELENREWFLGGEPSGHLICREAATTGDGIITALQVLSAMRHTQQSLKQLHSGLNKYPQVLLNIKVKDQGEVQDKPRVQKALHAAQQSLGKLGRVLIRRSGTEACVRVMVEGKEVTEVERWAAYIAQAVREELVLVNELDSSVVLSS
ncbi:MAG TPA: phosphoglucosamine mutase, partial [Gammaproteobacteria bacterium]|nr:phosphoglucosamine mutase [Gammaproteobacteria bacterium]